MPSITEKELRIQLNASEIAENAESKYRAQVIKKLSFAQSITAFVPVLWVGVWLSALALSAPHTMALFDLISQDLSIPIYKMTSAFDIPVITAPLAIEIAIAVLAGMREYGIRRWDFLILTFALMIVSIGVNVIGGANLLLSTDPTLFANDFIRWAWLFLGIVAGLSVSFVSFYAGTILMQFAKGDIKLEASFDDWYGLIKYDMIRIALFESATTLGAGVQTADKYARRTAFLLCRRELISSEDGKLSNAPRNIESEVSSAIASAQTMTVATANATVATINNKEFGFAGMTRDDPSQTIITRNDRPTVGIVATIPTDKEINMSSTASIRNYLIQNENLIHEFPNASDLCFRLSGSRDKIRNVQRAMKSIKDDLS